MKNGFISEKISRLSSISQLAQHPMVAIAILFAALPIITKPVGLDVGTEIVHLCLFAVAFNLLLGYTGIGSFGHSLWFGLGAYGLGLFQIYVFPSTSVALVFVMILCAAVALILGALMLRRSGVYFSLLTLAFSMMFFTIAFRWNVTGGEHGLQGIIRYPISPLCLSISSRPAFYVFTCLISFAGIFLLWKLLQTPYGKTLQGIRENERRMRLLGYNTTAYKVSAFVISGAFSGLAGGLHGLLNFSVYAQVFDWQSAGTVLLMAVLGGSRYFIGPVIGAVMFMFLQHYLSSVTENWMVVVGAIFVCCIVFLPNGIASLFPIIKARLTRRVTSMAETPFPRPIGIISKEERQRPAFLRIKGLSKRFGAIIAADNIDLTVERGQLLSVIGPNGAGKTTIFNMISGLLPIDSGKLLLNDIEIQFKEDYQRARLGLARSFQIVNIFKGLSVFENIRLAVQSYRGKGNSVREAAHKLQEITADTWAILDKVGLTTKAHLLAEQLTHGDQRLVDIGISMASHPPIFLLDEPLAGLAEEERTSIAAMIRSLAPEHTVVLVEHDIDRVLAISDRVAVLHGGKLVANADPLTVASDPEVLRVYLGTTKGEKKIRVKRKAVKQGETLLSVENLSVFYGKSQALYGVSFHVCRGEIVGLLGRNGVGKTTTVMSIGGILRPGAGRINFMGQDITHNSPEITKRMGLGIVPQGRRIFPNLTVLENLRMAQIPGKQGAWSEEKVFKTMPRLSERRDQKGRHLSGGEQQLLAIARSLMGPLEFLILDEPLEGLSPVMCELIVDAIKNLSEEGMPVLLVEQASNALQLADRVYVMSNGQVIFEGNGEELISNDEKQRELFAVQL